MSKVFLSYRRADPDQSVVAYIQSRLEAAGHDVFRDVDIPVGQKWAEVIQAQLREADVFIVFISEQSMDRDMVREEVKQVYQQHRETNQPVILPVRLQYQGALPYDMNAWLSPIQYALWEGAHQNDELADQLIKAIAGTEHLPHAGSAASAAQRETLLDSTEFKGKPLPKAEPPSLDVIGMREDNPFYVERQVDELFLESLKSTQSVATLHAPRQMGKSSLINRTRKRLKDIGINSLFLDLKILGTEPIEDNREALLNLAFLIQEQANLDVDPESFFKKRGFAATQFQRFLSASFGGDEQKTVLFMDDTDTLFDTPYRNQFFASLRAVIDARSQDPSVRKIGFGFAHSYDPATWIDDKRQSPFNVAVLYPIPEFGKPQLLFLNRMHGNCIADSQIEQLLGLLGGHPYLTRTAFYRLSQQELTLEELKQQASLDDGPFGDHLRSRLMSLLKTSLAPAFKCIIDSGCCEDPLQFQSLLALGMVKGPSHREAQPRFELYETYFKGRLDG